MTTGWCGRMQASFGPMHDADTLLHHPRHHATKIPAPANQINEFSWKNQLSEKNEHRELIPCPCRASEASGARLAGHLHYQVACTQGGETVTRPPRESCSSQTCRSGYHSSPSHLQATRGRMQPERPPQRQHPVTTSLRDCVSHMQQVDPSSKN
jgi:hypothetical protein